MAICPHCKQPIRKLNPHRMDRQKVRMLEILAKAKVEGYPWVQTKAGGTSIVNEETIRAPYRAQAHVSRLVWFGLAEHGPTRSGLYRITDLGWEFLFGAATVPEVIYCKDGKVVDQDTAMVGLNQVKNVILDKEYWDHYAEIQVDA